MSHPKTAFPLGNVNATAIAKADTVLKNLLKGKADNGSSNQNEVSGPAVLWGLIATAVGAMTGPSLLNAHLNGGDANVRNDSAIVAYHSSPLICLISALLEVAYGIWSLFRRRQFIRLPTQNDRENGSRKAKAIVAVLKLVVFAIGVIPQALQVLATKGIPIAQACVCCFVAATIGGTLRSFSGRTTESQMDDLTCDCQNRYAWSCKTLNSLRKPVTLLLTAAHVLSYLFLWHSIAGKIPFPTNFKVLLLARTLLYTGALARIAYTVVFIIGSVSGQRSRIWSTSIVTPAVWLYPIYALLTLPDAMFQIRLRQESSGLFTSLRSAFDVLESLDCDLSAISPLYETTKALYQSTHDRYHQLQESSLDFWGNRIHRASVISSAAVLLCIGAAFALVDLLGFILKHTRPNNRASSDLPDTQPVSSLQRLDYAMLQLPAHQFIGVTTSSSNELDMRTYHDATGSSDSETDAYDYEDDELHPYNLFSVPYLTRTALPNLVSMSWRVLKSEWNGRGRNNEEQTMRLRQRRRSIGNMTFDVGSWAIEAISSAHDRAIYEQSTISADNGRNKTISVTANAMSYSDDTSGSASGSVHDSDLGIGSTSDEQTSNKRLDDISQTISTPNDFEHNSPIATNEHEFDDAVRDSEIELRSFVASMATPGISTKTENQAPSAFQCGWRSIKDCFSFARDIPFLVVMLILFAFALLGIGPHGKTTSNESSSECDPENNIMMAEEETTLDNGHDDSGVNAVEDAAAPEEHRGRGQPEAKTHTHPQDRSDALDAEREPDADASPAQSLLSWLCNLIATFSVTAGFLSIILVSVLLSAVQSVCSPWAVLVWAWAKATKPKYRDTMWLAFALFNLLTCAAYYLAVFDAAGTRDPSWTDWLGS